MARHDVPVVTALIARLCGEADMPPGLDAVTLESCLRAPAGPLRGLVAERFGYIVGYALMEVGGAGDLLDLQQLFVMEGSRGRGLGRGLVDAAMATARESGCRALVARPPLASVHAPGFYGALGFQADGAAADYVRALP